MVYIVASRLWLTAINVLNCAYVFTIVSIQKGLLEAEKVGKICPTVPSIGPKQAYWWCLAKARHFKSWGSARNFLGGFSGAKTFEKLSNMPEKVTTTQKRHQKHTFENGERGATGPIDPSFPVNTHECDCKLCSNQIWIFLACLLEWKMFLWFFNNSSDMKTFPHSAHLKVYLPWTLVAPNTVGVKPVSCFLLTLAWLAWIFFTCSASFSIRWKLKVQKSHWNATSHKRLRWLESWPSSEKLFPHFWHR